MEQDGEYLKKGEYVTLVQRGKDSIRKNESAHHIQVHKFDRLVGFGTGHIYHKGYCGHGRQHEVELVQVALVEICEDPTKILFPHYHQLGAIQVYPEGTHLMIPWIERPVIYDVRARPHLVESTSGSRNLQMVKIGLRVLTRPYADQLPTIYRTLGENYNDGQCTMDNYIMPAFSVILFVSHGYWKPSMLQNLSAIFTCWAFFPTMKVMLKLDLHDDKAKQKAMKAVSTLSGIDFIRMDMKEQKLTVIGSVDPVDVVSKLRKNWHAEIFSVGPAKEPEKKEEPKKEEPKKEEPKKEEPKKEVEKKDASDQMVSDLVKAYQAYNPQMTTYYYVQSAEENPNSCVIC